MMINFPILYKLRSNFINPVSNILIFYTINSSLCVDVYFKTWLRVFNIKIQLIHPFDKVRT